MERRGRRSLLWGRRPVRKRSLAGSFGVEKDFIPARKAHPASSVDDLAGMVHAGDIRLPETSRSQAAAGATSPVRSATGSNGLKRTRNKLCRGEIKRGQSDWRTTDLSWQQ